MHLAENCITFCYLWSPYSKKSTNTNNTMNCYRTFVALIGIAAACMAVSSCQDNQKSTTMSDQNPVIENMMARRSIRQYQPQPVEREKMEVILNCGINAPNGQNKQSWEIRVVDDPAQMDAIIEAMAKANPEVDEIPDQRSHAAAEDKVRVFQRAA